MPDVTDPLIETLTIDRLGAGGDGIALDDAGQMFIAGALAGEVVATQANPRDRRRPILDHIITPSADRVSPPCPYFGTCGGCALQFMSPSAVLVWKQSVVKDALWMRGIDQVVASAPVIALGDRRRFVLKAVKQMGKMIVGFNRRGAHDVIDIDHCLLLTPGLNAMIGTLRSHLGPLLPERAWAKIHGTQCSTGLDISIDSDRTLAAIGLSRLTELLHQLGALRLTWNGTLIAAAETPRINIGGHAVEVPPKAFLQASQMGEHLLIDRVVQMIGPAKRVADLFCGVGTFSLPIARVAQVSAFDSQTDAVAALNQAARHAGGIKPIKAISRDLFRAPLTPDELNNFDAVIIDPPRAGADAQMRHLAASAIGTIAAISCDPGTFARDARILIDGGYDLRSVEIIDQFVWSTHIELIAHFTRPIKTRKGPLHG
jgi:23S rRNA (uracil1939-C5)-methyltransferase